MLRTLHAMLRGLQEAQERLPGGGPDERLPPDVARHSFAIFEARLADELLRACFGKPGGATAGGSSAAAHSRIAAVFTQALAGLAQGVAAAPARAALLAAEGAGGPAPPEAALGAASGGLFLAEEDGAEEEEEDGFFPAGDEELDWLLALRETEAPLRDQSQGAAGLAGREAGEAELVRFSDFGPDSGLLEEELEPESGLEAEEGLVAAETAEACMVEEEEDRCDTSGLTRVSRKGSWVCMRCQLWAPHSGLRVSSKTANVGRRFDILLCKRKVEFLIV